MPDRRTFAPLHPTTRKYAYGEVDGEPLPKELQELVERLRKVERISERRETQCRAIGKK